MAQFPRDAPSATSRSAAGKREGKGGALRSLPNRHSVDRERFRRARKSRRARSAQTLSGGQGAPGGFATTGPPKIAKQLALPPPPYASDPIWELRRRRNARASPAQTNTACPPLFFFPFLPLAQANRWAWKGSENKSYRSAKWGHRLFCFSTEEKRCPVLSPSWLSALFGKCVRRKHRALTVNLPPFLHAQFAHAEGTAEATSLNCLPFGGR